MVTKTENKAIAEAILAKFKARYVDDALEPTKADLLKLAEIHATLALVDALRGSFLERVRFPETKGVRT